MSYYGQYPFNTNGGALLSKRNYINKKLDEIEQKLLQLGWIEPEQESITEESISDEYNLPIESAGALLPYRDKVNKRLDFFEEVIRSHIYDHPEYNERNNYNNYNTNNYNNFKPQQQFTKEQEDVRESFNSRVNDLFG